MRVGTYLVGVSGALLPVMALAAAPAEEIVGRAIIVTGTREGYRAIDATSGTKTRTPLLDIPQTIDVVTESQIRDQAIRSVTDLVRLLPGVSAGQGEGHRDQVTLRGNNSTADFFVDGLRDDAQYFRSFYNVDRVEVHKGPNAMVFGRGGGGGVINRLTKGALIGRNQGLVTGSLDSFGSAYVAADANVALTTQAALRLNSFYERLVNHRDGYGGNRLAINPTIGANLGAGGRVQVGYEYVRDDRSVDRGIPSALTGSISAPAPPLPGYRHVFFGARQANRATFEGHILRTRAEWQLAPGLMFTTQALLGNYDKLYANAYPATAVAAGTVGIEAYRDITTRRSIIGQANLEWRLTTGGIGHVILAGAELTDQKTFSERVNGFFPTIANPLNRRVPVALAPAPAVPEPLFLQGNLGPAVGNRQIDGQLNQYSFYVQDQISMSPHWQIIVGVRYDRLRNDIDSRFVNARTMRIDNLWSPRAGLVYKPTAATSVYASWSRSFLPQSGDQFVGFDPSYAALAPEAFENFEAGLKWDVRPGLTLTGALYRLDRTNTRAAGPTPGTLVLTGQQRTEGFEATLAGKIRPNWQTALAVAHTIAAITSTTTAAPAGRTVAQTPRTQLSLWNRYDLGKRLGFGLGVFYQSSQFASISNAVRLPGYVRVDAALFMRLTNTIDAQVNVENLTNTNYFPSAHNDNNISTGAPRNARLTITAKF